MGLSTRHQLLRRLIQLASQKVSPRKASNESLESGPNHEDTDGSEVPQTKLSAGNLIGNFFTKKKEDGPHGKGLGTYSGVLIPTCENMWGVLIFLRFFYIVGNAGIWQTCIIVFLSFLCALLTTMSLSAIATNGPIEEGGTYYLISRALGPRLGGAVGCMYYVGVLLLAVLEALGAVEVIVFAFPDLQFPSDTRIIGAILLLFLGTLVYFGIKFVSKLGMLFFLIVIYTMLSYYMGLFTAPRKDSPPTLTGLSWNTFKDNWNPGYQDGVTFSVAVSIFFPCFTGILSGADRAKNLKKPEKSIPAGTLGAVLISLVMYLSYMLLWAAVGTRQYLLGHANQPDYLSPSGAKEPGGGGVHGGDEKLLVVQDVAFPLAIVTEIGIIIASLSQALQCLITSPRLLQAIAGDGVLPFLNVLAKQSATGEPRRALLFTTCLCMAAAMIGSLDSVAPLVSICFLTCYSALNFSCFVLSVLKAPSWRPKWKYYHASFALLGFLLCAAMNFVILWYWAVVAVILLVLIYSYIDYRQVEVDWGTGLGGLRLQLAVQSILAVGHEAQYSVNWRPQLLCLSKPKSTWARDGHAGKEFLAFASQLKKGKGLCVVTVILEGKLGEFSAQVAAERLELENMMETEKVYGFGKILVAPSYREGKTYAIQTSGLGSLEPNTLVLGWPQRWQEEGHEDSAEILLETLAECKAMEKAVLVCLHLDEFPITERQEGYIDVWWIVHDGGLLLLLAYLLTQNRIWKKCKLRVHTVAEKLDNSEEVRRNLIRILDQVRIKAEVEVLELDDAGLAPYTFDYTLRMEEAQAYAEKLASYRKEHHDHPSGSRKKAAQFGIASERIRGEENSYTRIEDKDDRRLKKGVIFKDTIPAELSMIEGAAVHTPRGPLQSFKHSTDYMGSSTFERLSVAEIQSRRNSSEDDQHHEVNEGQSIHLGTRETPEQLHAQEFQVHPRQITGRTTSHEEGESSCEMVGITAAVPAPLGRRKELEILVDLPGTNSDVEDEAISTHADVETRDENGERRTVVRTGSAGQLLYPGSPYQSNPEILNDICEPLKRTWETFSQNYSPKHLNDIILEQSKDAQLVLISLPDHYSGMEPARYMNYCEELTQGLSRVLFVRGTGKELWSGTGLL